MPSPPETLKARKEFLAMNRAQKWVTPGFILQYEPYDVPLSGPCDAPAPRLGYTVSKKVGNAVVRNTMKRRFRALAAEHLLQEPARIVLIGRPGAQKLAFSQLVKDLRWALKRVKAKTGPKRAAL